MLSIILFTSNTNTVKGKIKEIPIEIGSSKELILCGTQVLIMVDNKKRIAIVNYHRGGGVYTLRLKTSNICVDKHVWEMREIVVEYEKPQHNDFDSLIQIPLHQEQWANYLAGGLKDVVDFEIIYRSIDPQHHYYFATEHIGTRPVAKTRPTVISEKKYTKENLFDAMDYAFRKGMERAVEYPESVSYFNYSEGSSSHHEHQDRIKDLMSDFLERKNLS